MAFINNSVGTLGRNQMEDVKVIQWLLNQANIGYGFTNVGNTNTENSFSRLPRAKNAPKLKIPKSPGIQITGKMDGATQKAIDDFAYWCYRKQFLGDALSRLSASATTILSDSDLYKRLIWAAVHTFAPKFIATDDDYNDPRIKQALDNRITFIQFQFILEQSRWKGLTALGKEMQKLLARPEVSAFLDMIAKAEAWFDNEHDQVAYDDRVGFVKLTNLYQHPGRVSGRYQFTADTWAIAKRELGLYDFTPESQDIAGVYLLYSLPYTGDKILPSILSGDIEEAIYRSAGTWASFPDKNNKNDDGKQADVNGSKASHYYPQKNAPLNQLLTVYNNYLGERQKR
jgi:muramidase (phage lysozyme)